MSNPEVKVEGLLMKAVTFVGKAMIFVLPVVAGIYATRFIDRKLLKGKVKTISE